MAAQKPGPSARPSSLGPAESLARHSTIVLTMDHYTHTLIGDERAALDRLPSIDAPRANVAALAATGT